MTAKSAANKPRIKQSFLCAWIERACHRDIAGGIANSRRKACGSQRLEAFLGFEKCLCVIGVEVMPSLQGEIGYDLLQGSGLTKVLHLIGGCRAGRVPRQPALAAAQSTGSPLG